MASGRGFYNLLSGLQAGNMGPEMYVRASGLDDYGEITHDPDYYPAPGEKTLWRRCAAMITGHIETGLMAAPLNGLVSDAARGATGRRLLAAHWEPNLSPEEAAAEPAPRSPGPRSR